VVEKILSLTRTGLRILSRQGVNRIDFIVLKVLKKTRKTIKL
jgi:hypothetical protein